MTDVEFVLISGTEHAEVHLQVNRINSSTHEVYRNRRVSLSQYVTRTTWNGADISSGK